MGLYRNIMVAVDFSPHSEKAVSRATALAEALDARLQLVHVVEVPTYPVLEDVAVSGLPGMWDVNLTEALMEASRRRLHNVAKRFGLSEDQCEVLVGVAKVDLVEHADQVGADLIVMGRHGEGFFESLVGSVTDSVMHHAHCDVLAVDVEVPQEKDGERVGDPHEQA
ncbi:universal stress protein [Sulfurivirga sp.]|uniref:universal stress protein n=1 Tax=Sulfurivirga sp. TaxID=2614236 RepID=UPI0025D064B7|nr:universal stress protein [Sulfurivirga sp.]